MDVKLVTYGRMREVAGTLFSKMDTIDLSITPDYEFQPGIRYLVLWNSNNNNDNQAYKVITKDKGIHLGPRNEGHFDISQMNYVTTRNGLVFKFVYPKFTWITNWLTKDEFDKFNANINILTKRLRGAKLANGISKKNGKPWFRLSYQIIDDKSPDIDKFIHDESYVTPPPKIRGYKIIRDVDDIDKSFNYFLNTSQLYGLDFETNGFPFDSEDFYHMGVSIVGVDGFGAYYDMEGMRSITNTFDHFLSKFKEFLDAKAEDCYAYNVGFEMRCIYLLYHKLYWLHEASTVNVCDGFNAKKYSLKWTAQRCLHVSSWDDDFDYLCDKLHYLMNGIQNKKGEYELEPCTIDNYHSSDIWKEIESRYPNDLDEFNRLIHAYWGKPFKCIPANILGKYCCIDSFNTVLLRKDSDTRYDDRCWSCYDNNLRMAALIQICGGNLDISHRRKLLNISQNLVVASRIKVIKYWLSHQASLVDIEDIGFDTIGRMIKFGLNPFDCRSYLPNQLADTDSGINEGIGNLLDPDDYEHLINGLAPLGRLSRRSFRSINIFKDIDNYFKEKYHFSEGVNSCSFLVGGELRSFDYSIKEIIDHFYYLRLLSEIEFLDLQLYSDDKYHTYLFRSPESIYKQLTDNHISLVNQKYELNELIGKYGSKGDLFGGDSTASYIVKTPEEILDYISNIHNLQSPANFPGIRFAILNDFYKIYGAVCGTQEGDLKYEVLFNPEYSIDRSYKDEYVPLMRIDQYDVVGNYIYLRNIYSSIIDKYRRLIINPFISNINPDNIEIPEGDNSSNVSQGLKDQITNVWRTYELDHDPIRLIHEFSGKLPEIINSTNGRLKDAYKEFNTYLKEDDKIDKYLWLCGHFDYHMSAQCYDKLDDNGKKLYLDNFWNTDTSERNLMSFAIINTCNKMHKKYQKIHGTYLSGHFTKFNRFVNDEDENGISTERFHTGTYDQLTNQRIYFPYQELSCKSKRWSGPYHTIPSKSESKKILRAPKGRLISYFDISGAEVRGISYTAPSVNPDGTIDPTKLGDQYMVDCYEKKIDPYINLAKQLEPGKDKWYYKSVRATMKTILLGLLYGMGVESMSTSAEVPIERAMEVRDIMFHNMRGIAKLIEQKGNYCVEHQGEVQTGLGDRLSVGYEPDRWMRLGIKFMSLN
jgi:hypothetical protein